MHATLDDRVLDAEEFGNARLHGWPLLRREVERPGILAQRRCAGTGMSFDGLAGMVSAATDVD
jgi:hypothetical protein